MFIHEVIYLCASLYLFFWCFWPVSVLNTRVALKGLRKQKAQVVQNQGLSFSTSWYLAISWFWRCMTHGHIQLENTLPSVPLDFGLSPPGKWCSLTLRESVASEDATKWHVQAFSCSFHPQSVGKQTCLSTQEAWQKICYHISESCVLVLKMLPEALSCCCFLLISCKYP